MIDYSSLYPRLSGTALEAWGHTLPAMIEQRLNSNRHGDYEKWLTALQSLPPLSAETVDLIDSVTVTSSGGGEETRKHLEQALRQLHPWRKGPFFIHGIHIDTEWRSDWKWERLKNHIAPLTGRTVLDVGCGSGYHCWRMAGMGAALVIGIDPTLLYVMQYFAIRHLLGEQGKGVPGLKGSIHFSQWGCCTIAAHRLTICWSYTRHCVQVASWYWRR